MTELSFLIRSPYPAWMARRLRCLQDFSAEGVDAIVRCGNPNCGRERRFDPRVLLNHIRKERYIFILRVQGEHLPCSVCGAKKTKIAPVPRIKETPDCDELAEDVRALWRKIWERG